MIFTNKTFAIILFCGIALSSAYVLVKASEHYAGEIQPSEPAAVAPPDSSKNNIPQFPIKKYKQDTYDELNTKYPMDAPKPDNVKSVVEYDLKSGNYILRTFVGENEIATPFLMTGQEYRNYSEKKDMQSYWKEKNSKVTVNNEDKYSISDMKFNIGPADKVFGPGGVQIKTQGSAELIFGFKSNTVDNPALTERMRTSNIFDFNEKIQMNVTGTVGDKVNFGLNYNTESSFDFDQKMVKLAYKGKEDDIIKNIEAGNVSMPLNSSLITGSTALFGIKAELQFGKLNVVALASQQESQTQTVSSQGGAQTTKFDIPINNYDQNKHFFLSHYFRNTYESNVSKLPYITSGITINRIEAWVTNKRGVYDQARNVVAFMDLAETDSIDNRLLWHPSSTIKLPVNSANNLYTTISLLPGIRDIQQTNSILSSYVGQGFTGGEDYEKIESARKLDPSEFTFSPNLGYISLRTALNPDEVLGVAYEYTYNGNVYQVGEFSTDPIGATNATSTANATNAPNALILKLLKSTSESPKLKSWKLMLKNIYNLGTLSMQQDKFILNIVYRNDSIGTDMQYLTEGNVKNKLLLRVMNLDNLDQRNAPNPDGKFDYIEGYTVQSASGLVIIPLLEPFGSHLRKAIGNDNIANKYIYQELYDSSLVAAQQFSQKNKFHLVGVYKGSSGSEIRLNASNVPRGSVTVTAGGVTLVENTDYTVDYTMGTVTIINTAIIQSGTNIDVKLENQSLFNMQRKTLMGTHLEYKFNKDFSMGGTIMHLSELPLTTKVNTGNEPISNTIWGLNTSWRSESQLLTNILNKIPFVNATKPSTIAINAEFAQLIPGHSDIVGAAGTAYIDDFESTQTSIDIHYPANWYLASTPYNSGADALFPEAALSDNVNYGKNRALLAWYNVDPLFNNSDTQDNPDYIRNNLDAQSNNITRDVMIPEIFPAKQTLATQTSRMTIMNLSYYPTERGPYNLDADGLNPDGTLANPTKRWGGIMRKMDATDFDVANIEYIEFWMMDPYVNGGMAPDKKGELYFNLGDVSEDILKDGKKSYESGLPIDGDISKTDTTVWGRVPQTQTSVYAFDNSQGARINQDVGLDGLSDAAEKLFPTYSNYVNQIKSKLNPDVLQKMQSDPLSPINDPAGDDYHFYRGSDYDKQQLDVLTRYKHYNGVEGNSPDASNVTESYATSATSLPDGEDINGDNTMNEYEKYYQYKVSIDKSLMRVGSNYITDAITSVVELKNGKTDSVTWYQFKIPIRTNPEAIGGINNFKSIRFMRMFMTNFDNTANLRLATLDLVRGEWRAYDQPLIPKNVNPATNATLDIQAVNIEENASKSPVNYVLPPGITRETDPGQPQLLLENEQSMDLRVTNLAPADARAVYKATTYDMRQYKRLQMFVHAEKMLSDTRSLNDYDLTCFIRIGSDMVSNYYEYEIPMRLTPAGVYLGTKLSDQQIVWYPENTFDFPFSALTDAKSKRNLAKQTSSTNVSDLTPYVVYDPDKPLNKISIVGNPSISDVENIMIGVRNASGSVKSGEIWADELRMSQYDESGGWAAMGNLAVGLSDIGSINISGQIQTAGYGGIDSNVMTRRMDDLYQMNFSTSLELGRFLPEALKLKIPAYYSYSNQTTTPKYNPLDQDILLSTALNNTNSQAQRDSLNLLSQTVNTTKSFNITGAKVNIKSKKPQFYDPANVAFTYVYNETNEQSPDLEQNLVKEERAAVNYSFAFNPKPFEPFKKLKALDSPVFKIIKDFNFNYLPSSFSFLSNLDRQYSQVKLRDLSITSTDPSVDNSLNLTHSTNFMWNNQFDLKYDLTRAIKFSFATVMNSNIAEPNLTPEIGKQYYEAWRDSVWSNIKKLGTPYTYQQVFSATWNLPINKIPLFDWVIGNASYNSTYNWNKMAVIQGGGVQPGNIASSMGAWQVDGQFNFESLYNKSKYLKEVNKRYGPQPTIAKQKFQAKTYTQRVNLEKNKVLTINHRLGSDKLKFTAIDRSGKILPLSYKTKNTTTVEVTPFVSADSVQLSFTTIDASVQEGTVKSTVDFIARTLMMFRKASFTYRESNSMVLPGFLPGTGFLGQDKTKYGNAPGYGFAFGLTDDSTIPTAMHNGWLSTDTTIVNLATRAFTSDLDIKVSMEPISGLKIDLSAKRYEAKNSSINYLFPGMPTTYTGSYNITMIALATAFTPTGSALQNYNSSLFNTFLSNRQVIADRLNAQYAGTNYPNAGFLKGSSIAGTAYNSGLGSYNVNSSDVLIPAFLAAYTGQNVKTVDTNPFLSLLSILPNWRISYDGLSNIDWVKERFKSVSLTHAYSCSYNIGSYTSYSSWVGMGSGSTLGYVSDVENQGNALPSSPYDISDVSINEQFVPLIGINVALKNSMTAKMEYRKSRLMDLNLSSTQLIESSSDEYVVGLGYVLKDFDVILKMKSDKQTKVKNDLKLSADLSYKDIKTLLRNVDQDITQASSGNKLFTLKIIADYVFSAKVNIQLFYDRQMSTPLISLSYPVSSSDFGMSIKFMLTR